MADPEPSRVLADTSCPLDFSQLTLLQFGISNQSFTPSASNCKEKSHLAKLKARRRSNIGVRGSPETNSLIRYIAQQRMKTPPTPKTPQLAKGSPFLPRVSSSLKQKIASFQSLMDVEEQEGCDLVPRQGPETGGCIKTRDYLSDERSPDGGKENCPPPLSPTPSKRRRLGPLRDCVGEIRGDSTPILQHTNVKEQETDKEPGLQGVTLGQMPSSETVQEAHAVFFFPHPHLNSPINNHQDGSFELQSAIQRQPTVLAEGLAVPPPLPLTVSSTLPSLQEMKPSGASDSTGNSPGNSTGNSTVKKKKRVHFGGPLSPELFDKNLPPSTPLQKGDTPARMATPGRGSVLQSVLKTPQWSEPRSSLAQTDFSSPSALGASPTLSFARSSRVQSVEEEDVEMCGKITFTSMEVEEDYSLTDSAGALEARPLDLNLAFQEESHTETLTFAVDPSPEPKALPSGPCQTDPLEQVQTQTEAKPDTQVPARSSRRTRKTGAQPESVLIAPARSSSRKNKQPEESEPVKRSTRSAAKSATGKMKQVRATKRRWGAKEVDHSLYGSREFASKNPSLSPITESLSSASLSPMPQQPVHEEEPRRSGFSEADGEPITEVTVAATLEPSGSSTSSDSQGTDCISSAEACQSPLEAAAKSVAPSKRRAPGKGGQRSGPTLSSRGERRDSGMARGGGRKGRKVSVPVDEWLRIEAPQDPNERDRNQTTASMETTEAGPSNQQKPDNRGSSVDTPTLDVHIITSVSEELAAQVVTTPSNARSRSRGRKSSVSRALQEAEPPVSQVEEQSEAGYPAGIQPDTSCGSSCDRQAEAGANLTLAPWQANFNSEDMFKPVATRGQRSVRRSLRNHIKGDCTDSGLAWLPRTSPDAGREVRRQARSRRLHTAPHTQVLFPEETHN